MWLVMAVLAGCGKKTPPASVPDAVAAAPEDCPTPETVVDMAQCEDLPRKHGLTAQTPLEWGDAGRGQLWFGRLMCPSGASPQAERTGNIGSVQYGSSAPLSQHGTAMSGLSGGQSPDIVDAWTIHCPGESQEWYANIYRCGNPCPPAGFRIMDAEAARAVSDADELLTGGQPSAALGAARKAHEIEPGADLPLIYQGLALIRMGRYVDALDSLEKALEIDPTASVVSMYAVKSAMLIEDWERGRAFSDTLLDNLSAEDPAYPDALCLHAEVLAGQGDAEAEPTRAAACEAGAESCCP